MTTAPALGRDDGPSVATVDLAALLGALDPGYLAGGHEARLTGLVHCDVARELYVVVGEGHVFVSRDGMRTLDDVAEINRCEGAIVRPALQAVDFVVETTRGTVLAIGRDRFDGASRRVDAVRDTHRAVVWRKPRGERTFTRHVVRDVAWSTNKSGNATAGFFGPGRDAAVAFVPYTDGGAHLFVSLDDGATWRAHDLSRYFVHHAHEAYLPRSVGNARTARLWVTGGDDPGGTRSGLLCFAGLGDDGELLPAEWVVRERPGFRLVGLAGNGKHVYVGNESLAGGVLKLPDNAESIAAGDVEVAFGKARHDYHQFRSLIATFDGLVASGTDSYRQYAGDSVRADAGGYLYVSTNEGASAIEIPLGGTWTTGVAYDGEHLWCGVSATCGSGPDVSVDALRLLRVRRPDPLHPLLPPFVAKPVVVDSSRFYQWAGYAQPPSPVLLPGERTWRVDMSCWTWLGLDVLARADGTLVVEGLPYTTWTLAEDAWRDVATLACEAGTRRLFALPGEALGCRHLRVRNAGASPLPLDTVAFVGRR